MKNEEEESRDGARRGSLINKSQGSYYEMNRTHTWRRCRDFDAVARRTAVLGDVETDVADS